MGLLPPPRWAWGGLGEAGPWRSWRGACEVDSACRPSSGAKAKCGSGGREELKAGREPRRRGPISISLGHAGHLHADQQQGSSGQGGREVSDSPRGPVGRPAWVLSLATPRYTGAQWSLSLPRKVEEPASHEAE